MGTFGEVSDAFASKIKYPAGRANNNVNSIIESYDIVFKPSTTSRYHDIDAKVLPQSLANLRCLKSKLSCWDQNKSLYFVALGIDLVECRYDESTGLPGAIFCSC